MNTPKVSIIVPIFKVADCLNRGVDSILSQSFRDFELILVDDGSPDACGRICDEYALQDDRVKVIHKENGGVSSARNAGLAIAQGEWVYFPDPDDELMEDAILTLVNGISDDVDVVLGGFEEIDPNGEIVRLMRNQTGEKKYISKLESLKPIFAPYSDDYSPVAYLGYICIRLFRKKVIKENGLRFDESIANREAGLFTVNYLCVSRGTTCYVMKPIYRYIQRPSSAIMSLNYGFNKTVLTSFDSTILMVRLISAIYPSGSEIVKRAKEEVMERYRTIKGLMIKFDVKDEKVLSDFRKRCVKELGIPFLVGYVYVWGIGKVKKIMNRICKKSSK